MEIVSLILALFKAAPGIIDLFKRVMALYEDNRARNVGFDDAINRALQQAAKDVQAAREARDEAEYFHSSHPDDSAFDQEFMRKG